jgi:carboxypeptidase T
LLPDETIRLNWEAITDQQHDYFEIEKSANGSTFTLMGKGPSSAPYWRIDTSPFIGNNFYRIRQVDKNGTTSYSTIINVYYSPGLFNVSVYPNPVTDVLNIKINSAITEQYVISITDMTGRKIFEEKVVSTGSGIQSTVDLRKQASQLFILTVKNSKNEIVATQKLVKK